VSGPVQRPIQSIDAAEAADRLGGATQSGALPLLVDVREPSEFEERHIRGAMLLPLSSLAEDYEQLPRDRPLILQCASGRRSLAAAEYLSRQGYEDLSNLEGGILAWQKAGQPTESGPVEPGGSGR
jgi:rhodanese-related sulfurtransferase